MADELRRALERVAELELLVLRLAERILAAHEVLANLAEKGRKPR